jgi:hypothetical protein
MKGAIILHPMSDLHSMSSDGIRHLHSMSSDGIRHLHPMSDIDLRSAFYVE